MKQSRRAFIVSALAASVAGLIFAGQASARQALSEDPIPGVDVIVEKVPPGVNIGRVTTGPRGEIAFRNLEAGYYEVRDLNNTVRAGIRHRGGPARWQLRQQRDSRRPIWTLADQSDPL